jgi:hypothetical protein
LRVSCAAWWKRNAAHNSEVADLLGDKSERMGAHYTRHVEAEANVSRAFTRVNDEQVLHHFGKRQPSFGKHSLPEAKNPL